MPSNCVDSRRWRPEHAELFQKSGFPFDHCRRQYNAITNCVCVSAQRARPGHLLLASMRCGFLICYELQLCFFHCFAVLPNNGDACVCVRRSPYSWGNGDCSIHFNGVAPLLRLFIRNQQKGSIFHSNAIRMSCAQHFPNGFLSPPKIVRTWLAERCQLDEVECVMCDNSCTSNNTNRKRGLLTIEDLHFPHFLTNDEQTRLVQQQILPNYHHLSDRVHCSCSDAGKTRKSSTKY